MKKTIAFTISIYALFFLTYWIAPIQLFDEDRSMDMFRYYFIRIFILTVIGVLVFLKKWKEAAILVLFSITFVSSSLLAPIFGLRFSLYFLPNVLTVSWAFASISSVMYEWVKKEKVGIIFIILLAVMIFILHIFNPLTLLLFTGPR